MIAKIFFLTYGVFSLVLVKRASSKQDRPCTTYKNGQGKIFILLCNVTLTSSGISMKIIIQITSRKDTLLQLYGLSIV